MVEKLSINEFVKKCKELNVNYFEFSSSAQAANENDGIFHYSQRYDMPIVTIHPDTIIFRNSIGDLSFSTIRYVTCEKIDKILYMFRFFCNSTSKKERSFTMYARSKLI